jgi:glyoxylase-like metal-dependent hydrolase (beta-lactamase superfamily II)
MEAFPGFWGYAYLVIVDDYVVLVDTGSGFGDASQQLEAGLHAVSGLSGQDVGLANLTHIFITHGHIDHFGGLAYVRPRTSAKLGVHELDRRILTNYEERLTIIARRLSNFLIDAGVSPERREKLLNLYLLP